MFTTIIKFIVEIIFWVFIIVCFIGWLLSPILTYLLSCLGVGKKSYKSTYKTKNKTKKSYKTQSNKKTPSRLPGVHEDYDKELQEELIKEGKYDSYNFEEEDLEEDDYHYEDDK